MPEFLGHLATAILKKFNVIFLMREANVFNVRKKNITSSEIIGTAVLLMLKLLIC